MKLKDLYIFYEMFGFHDARREIRGKNCLMIHFLFLTKQKNTFFRLFELQSRFH